MTLLSQACKGTTYEEIKRSLYLNDDKAIIANQYNKYFELFGNNTDKSELIIANHIYVARRFQLNEDFQKMATAKFNTGVECVDFSNQNETAHLINTFVANKTRGKIQEIITPDILDADCLAFLVNTIYLRSAWLKPFPKCLTHKDKFYISETDTVDVAYMQMKPKTKIWHTEVNGLNAAAVRLDYANSSLSFVIILPNNRTGLSTLESQTSLNLSQIIDEMKYRYCRIKIPKFKVESEFDMINIMKKVCVSFSNQEQKIYEFRQILFIHMIYLFI